MSVGRTRVGIVGTGYLGRLHARILTEMPEVEVVGFVEANDATAAAVSESLSIRRFDSVQQLAGQIECAVIATDTTSHAPVALEMIETGRDVMIEKPITTTPDEARSLIRAASARDRIIQVGHVERYNPAIVAVDQFIAAPHYIEAQRLGVFSGRSLDIDVLLDLMIHDIQLVLSFVKREITSIEAVGIPVLTGKVDMANVRIEFDNGAVASLTASRVSSDRVRKFRVFGRDSYVSVDTKEQEAKGYSLVEENGERVIRATAFAIEKKEPLRAELEAFISCVKSRKTPLVSGDDGLHALEVAKRVGEAIDRSLQKWRASDEVAR